MLNLDFAGKLVDKVAVKHLNVHVNTKNLDVLLQSGYKVGHSVENALVKVYNDLLCAVDSKGFILLSLLDLSAMFDLVGHDNYYINGTARKELWDCWPSTRLYPILLLQSLPICVN